MVALGIYCGKKWARFLCIIVSIIRIPTILGIPFSITTVSLLLFPKKSRDYFNATNDTIEVSERPKK
jgi:hypothetical protein